MKRKTISLEITKTKKGAIWERGGMTGNTGAAVVVARPDGSRKKALIVSSMPNGRHALVLVNQNDIIVMVKYINKMYEISIYRIQSTDSNTKQADMIEIANYKNCIWDDEVIAKTYQDVIENAKRLASTKNSREPVYCNYVKKIDWGK